MQKIFDTHAHYDDSAFDSDRHELLKNLPNQNVGHVINCATDISTSHTSIEFTQKYPYMYAAIGVHPQEATTAPSDYLDTINMLSLHSKVVAIGEIGLDYHYIEMAPKNLQLKIFEAQLKLANELNLPVIVHDREAHADTLALLFKYKPKGVVHCFSGSVEMAHEILKLGMYIGLGGAVTFKNAKKPAAVAQDIPLDRLLLETDAPYMTPVPYRGKRCDSSHILYTAQKIAQLRDNTLENILHQAYQNACYLFSIPEK